MLEWILIFAMATLGAIAFGILFKAVPSSNTAELESLKLRNDLAKLANKEEQKKKQEKKEAEKKQKLKKEEKKKSPNTGRSPPKQRAAQPVVEEEEEAEEEEPRQIYVTNLPTQNNTPTTKVKRDSRSRSPPVMKFEEKAAQKEVAMPTKRQIERDMSQGFVVVSKKGPPPLTAEQKKERDLLRQKEEEEAKRREQEQLTREKERERKRAEAAVIAEVSMQDVKAKLDKQKAERQTKEEERRKVTCVVKEYTKMAQESEESEKKSWGAAMMPDGDEVPTVDAEDYPLLQTAE